MNNANPNNLSRLYNEARAAGCPKDQLVRFHDLAYVPFPKQLRFHAAARACDHPNGPTQLGFGGARGPGKSHASSHAPVRNACVSLCPAVPLAA